jgi:acetoin utilization protein AcuB
MLRLQDVMSVDVKTIAPGKTAEEAWSLMELHDIHHLVVVDGNEVVGVVSARDLGGKNGGQQRRGLTVGDVMHEKPVTATPTETIRQAANKLRGYGIGCLPVVDGKKVIGILTITDCLELIGRGAERPVEIGKRRPLTRKLGERQIQFRRR